MITRRSILGSICPTKYAQRAERELRDCWEGSERAAWRSKLEWWSLSALIKLSPKWRTNRRILPLFELTTEQKRQWTLKISRTWWRSIWEERAAGLLEEDDNQDGSSDLTPEGPLIWSLVWCMKLIYISYQLCRW